MKNDNLKNNAFKSQIEDNRLNKQSKNNDEIDDEIIDSILNDYIENVNQKDKQIKNNENKKMLLKDYFESKIQKQFYIVNNNRVKFIKVIISSIKPNKQIKNFYNKFNGPYLIGSYRKSIKIAFN